MHSHSTGFEAVVSAGWTTQALRGAPGESRTHTDAGFKPTASALGYGSMKWCPWQDLHPHWTASEAVVSALDYIGVKWRPWMDLHHQLRASKARALLIELQGYRDWSVRLESNQRTSGYEPDALTVKLQTNKNGRIPRCCPGRVLVPNQVSSLALSYPMKSGRTPQACTG